MTLVEDLRLNHEYCPREVILAAADEIERLERELRRIQQATKWQPIETAPKDGTGVLVYCEKSLHVPITGGYWDDHPQGQYWIAGGYMQKVFPPTHWMPLPAAPVDCAAAIREQI